MTATRTAKPRPDRTLTVERVLDLPSLAIVDVTIRSGRAVDAYRVKLVRDDFGSRVAVWQHATDPTRNYRVTCGAPGRPQSCSCPATRFRTGEICRHAAATAVLFKVGAIN